MGLRRGMCGEGAVPKAVPVAVELPLSAPKHPSALLGWILCRPPGPQCSSNPVGVQLVSGA